MGSKTDGYGKMSKDNAVREVRLPKEWPLKMVGNFLVLGFIFFVSAVILIWQNSWIEQQFYQLQQAFYDYTSHYCFSFYDVVIEGHNKISKKEILEKIKVSRNDNLFAISPDEIK